MPGQVVELARGGGRILAGNQADALEPLAVGRQVLLHQPAVHGVADGAGQTLILEPVHGEGDGRAEDDSHVDALLVHVHQALLGLAHARPEAHDVGRERALHAGTQRSALGPDAALEDDAAVAVVIGDPDRRAPGVVIGQPLGQTLLGLLAMSVGVDDECSAHGAIMSDTNRPVL